LRKSLLAAVAATAVIGGTATAGAQTVSDGASVKATVAPQKAGTKKKPANSSLHLVITNNDKRRTLRQLEIQIPRTMNVSGKGFTFCSKATLAAGGPAACPKRAKVGVGTASAFVGVDQPQPSPLNFEVTAFVAAKDKINFYLHSTGIPVNVVAPGVVKKTSKGPKLTVKVPQEAQQPAPGLYAGLAQLDTTIGARSGTHKLITSTGCKKHKQPFSVKLLFAANPATPSGSLTTKGAAKCR